MRDIIERELAYENNARQQALDESKETSQLTAKEASILKEVFDSNYWKNLSENHKDRHGVRDALVEFTSLRVSECDKLADKAKALIESGEFTSEVLTEGMGSTTTDDHEGAEDHGMYGMGDGGEKDEPKGDADSGTDQNSEHGDKAVHAKDGYLDEEDANEMFDDVAKADHNDPTDSLGEDDDEDYDEMPMDQTEAKRAAESKWHAKRDAAKRKVKELRKQGHDDDSPQMKKAKKEFSKFRKQATSNTLKRGLKKVDQEYGESEVQMDAPDGADDDERAAKDAYLKDGKGQMEAEDTGDGKNHKPVASDPGEPNHLKNADAPDAEQRGDVPDHPDYSTNNVKEEDPSKSELNKGPSAVKCEAFEDIESTVLTLLSESGLEPGSDKWCDLYSKGFAMAIKERASLVGKRLNSIQEALHKST